jgi:hypothetical protein
MKIKDLFLNKRFTKYWVVACILDFLVNRIYSYNWLFYIWDENFFSFNRSNGVSKNPSFYTYFKNVHLTLVKVHPKKFCLKNFAHLSIYKKVFWLKLFLGALFTKIKFTFLKSIWIDGFFWFLTPHSPYLKEKVFISENGQWNFLRMQKCKKLLYISKNVFHRPFKLLCHTSELLNLIKI